MRYSFDITDWISPEATAEFRQAVSLIQYNPGELLYSQGDEGVALFRIVSGYVRLLVRNCDGRQIVFLLFGPGDCFGASSLVDGELRAHTAEAVSKAQVEILGRDQFNRIVDQHRSFSKAVMKLLSLQMRVASECYVSTTLYTLESRIAARIVEIMGMHTKNIDIESSFPLHLSQNDLADMVGSSRQSVNKVLQEFKNCGLISLGTNRIIVNNKPSLDRIAAELGL